MAKTYAIDFESYYDANISVVTMGAHHYFRNGGDLYLMSVVGEDFQWVGDPRKFDWSTLKGAHLIAHNYAFDGTALLLLQEQGIAPKDLDILGGDCTADMAAYFQAPRNLKGAAQVMLGNYEEIDKSMRNYMKGRRWENVSPDMQERMKDYALKDSIACYELWRRWSDRWPDAEKRVSRHTREQMWRGMCVNTELLDEYLGDVQRRNWEAEQAIPWAGQEKLLSRKAFDAECRRSGITLPTSLAQDDPAAAAWMEEHSPRFPWVMAVNEWRRTNTMLSKLQAIKDRVREDGRITTELKYYGAGVTGRWSGAGGVNFQNMPRGEMFGVDLRQLFIAAPGKDLLLADLNAIEPRCTAYLTGDEAMLAALRRGEDVYQAYAKAQLGYEGDDLKKDDPNLRMLAKVALLSLAYGTGYKKLSASAKAMYGIDIPEADAEAMVNEYRSKNEHVTWVWSYMQDLFRKKAVMSRLGGLAPDAHELLKTMANDVVFTLASGRRMHLFDARREMGGLTAASVKNEDKRFYWYGSKLFQNSVQGTARDVFRDALLRVSDTGMATVLHIHDEIIVEADAGTDPRELIDTMAKSPEWAPNLPVAAAGFSSKHYTK